MSDFAQSGLISTFQQLNETHLPAIEQELTQLATERPIALILPCHASDLHRPALVHIVDELKHAAFCSEIIVSINGLDAAPDDTPRAVFAPLPQPVRILWNDRDANDNFLNKFVPGKGLNVWAALAILASEKRVHIAAVQDCDVASFRRTALARLCYACAHPQLNYAFAKMYYSRATDRLYGRVTRLFFGPLLHAIVRLSGHRPLIDFLLSFRYPLAGECALTLETAARLPMQSQWGLETGMLCELFRHVDPRDVCQVDGGSGYDHKHQSAEGSLKEMSGQIAQTLLLQLAEEGLTIDPTFLAALTSAYQREAGQAIRRSANLAQINGLPFDEIEEQKIVEGFANQIQPPDRVSSPALPSWATLARTEPNFLQQLKSLVTPVT